jgi:hypothetical protein
LERYSAAAIDNDQSREEGIKSEGFDAIDEDEAVEPLVKHRPQGQNALSSRN